MTNAPHPPQGVSHPLNHVWLPDPRQSRRHTACVGPTVTSGLGYTSGRSVAALGKFSGGESCNVPPTVVPTASTECNVKMECRWLVGCLHTIPYTLFLVESPSWRFSGFIAQARIGRPELHGRQLCCTALCNSASSPWAKRTEA